MSVTILLVALALGQAQPGKAVTDAEKKEFLEVLAKLPTKGEFFTEEAIAKAVPYTRVLLALSKKDLDNRDLYPFLALSRGLIDRKKPRQYGITNFGEIAHPTIKLFWAFVLFNESPPSPKIVTFVRKALDSKEDARTLSEMAGPGFEEFREQVIRTYEQGRQAKVEVDQYGDPLPKGAFARLGALRLHHPGHLESLVFSPDGKTLATSGADGQVCLWDWASGKELPRFPAANVGTVVFSPDGRLLATASDREKIRLWDIEKTKEIGALTVRRKISMVYRPALAFADGGKVLVYAGDDGVVQGWEVKSGRERLFFRLPENKDIFSAVAIAHGGKVLAYAVRWVEGTKAGPVCLVDMATGKELHCLSDQKEPIWSLAFSPDGTILASASTTEPPILWDVATGKSLRTLQGQKRFLAFSPDGRILASGDSRNKLRLWDVATGKQIKEFESDLLGTSCFAFSQDGKTLAVADGNAIRLLKTASGQEIKPQAEPTSAIHAVGWFPDGKTVALGTEDAVWLREAATGKALGKLYQTPKPLLDSVTFFAISPDGKYYGLARGASIQLFNTASRKPLHELVGSNQMIDFFVFSADSKTVAAAVGYGVVSVWDCATGKRRYHLDCKDGSARVALSSDGKTIATAYESVTGATSGIQLWDQASGKILRDLSINKAWVHALAFSADSKTLAALTDSQWADQGGLILWDLPAGKQRFRLPKVNAAALAFSPDGKLVACEGREYAVCLLDAETGKERHCFEGHRARLGALAFSSDGKMLVSGSWDATALVWDIAALKGADD